MQLPLFAGATGFGECSSPRLRELAPPPLSADIIGLKSTSVGFSYIATRGGAIRPENRRQVIFWAKKVGFSDFTAKSWLLGF